MNKPRYKLNKHGIKDSCDQYRNINGIYFEHWTSNNAIFEEEKVKAKRLGLKCRVIKGELYREKPQLAHRG